MTQVKGKVVNVNSHEEFEDVNVTILRNEEEATLKVMDGSIRIHIKKDDTLYGTYEPGQVVTISIE